MTRFMFLPFLNTNCAFVCMLSKISQELILKFDTELGNDKWYSVKGNQPHLFVHFQGQVQYKTKIIP